MSDRTATVIGAGLAGCEAAWQLAQKGIHVRLVEMKPVRMSPAHHSEQFAELVCSNSFRGDRLTNAVGLLKEEMRLLGSLIMRCADETRVPAGGALAVDRDSFSAHVTKAVSEHPCIQLVREEAVCIPDGPVIIATGPLTSDRLAEVIMSVPGLSTLNFYDAAAPIVLRESLDESKLFRLSRYNRGNDYLNAPMTEEQYTVFINELISAETAEVHGFEENRVFEGCMPIESMAKRGFMVPAFGPMKPVGLTDPRTGKEPFAVVQLRQDNASDTMYNLVGFQTRLKFGEQNGVSVVGRFIEIISSRDLHAEEIAEIEEQLNRNRAETEKIIAAGIAGIYRMADRERSVVLIKEEQDLIRKKQMILTQSESLEFANRLQKAVREWEITTYGFEDSLFEELIECMSVGDDYIVFHFRCGLDLREEFYPADQDENVEAAS